MEFFRLHNEAWITFYVLMPCGVRWIIQRTVLYSYAHFFHKFICKEIRKYFRHNPCALCGSMFNVCWYYVLDIVRLCALFEWFRNVTDFSYLGDSQKEISPEWSFICSERVNSCLNHTGKLILTHTIPIRSRWGSHMFRG